MLFGGPQVRGLRATLCGPRSKVCVPRSTLHGAWVEIRGPRLTLQSPRNSQPATRSCCAALRLYGEVIERRLWRVVCRQQAQMKLEPAEFGDPTSIGACLLQGRQKGGGGPPGIVFLGMGRLE